MNKERLEEIKDLLRLTKKENFVEDYYVLIKLFEYGHANWLIQQAERVQELEKRLKIYQKRSWFEAYEKVRKQNKRYREAILMALSDIDDYDFESVSKGLRKALEGEE